MAYLSIVPAADVPFDQHHVALYSYFPQAIPGERPYVWRAIGPRRFAVLSAVRSTAPICVQVTPKQGVTYDFALTCKRVRYSGDRAVTFTSYGDLREWIKFFVSNRGGAVGFITIERFDELKFQKQKHRVTIPIAHVRGKVLVTDAEAFEYVLYHGGPGTAKAYGCGMWWLPELMEPVLQEAAA